MKKGLFLKNWEVAVVYDMMAYVKLVYMEFKKEENEVVGCQS